MSFASSICYMSWWIRKSSVSTIDVSRSIEINYIIVGLIFVQSNLISWGWWVRTWYRSDVSLDISKFNPFCSSIFQEFMFWEVNTQIGKVSVSSPIDLIWRRYACRSLTSLVTDTKKIIVGKLLWVLLHYNRHIKYLHNVLYPSHSLHLSSTNIIFPFSLWMINTFIIIMQDTNSISIHYISMFYIRTISSNSVFHWIMTRKRFMSLQTWMNLLRQTDLTFQRLSTNRKKRVSRKIQ